MKGPLRLMCVLAHPDDESLGMGGTLAKYAVQGVETYLVTATRGERGWFDDEKENPGLEALGKIREAELLNAAHELGISEVKFLGYIDGDLDQADPAEVVAKIVSHLRRVRPDVVITFDPNGAYGHPDHIAICQFTTAAILAARIQITPIHLHLTAFQNFTTWHGPRKSSTHMNLSSANSSCMWMTFRVAQLPGPTGLSRPSLTPLIIGPPYGKPSRVTRVNSLHIVNSNISHPNIIKVYGGTQEFYRAISLVNGGRARETDLFEGLR